MRATHWIGLLLLAAGLLIAAFSWNQNRPSAETEPRAPAVVGADREPTASSAPDALRPSGDGSERIALDNAVESAATAPQLDALGTPPLGGARTGVWVKVVDEHHTPLEGVRVVLRIASRPRGKPEAMGTSDADGRVWLAAQLVADMAERRVEPAGPGTQVDGVTFDPAQLGDESVLLVLSDGAGLDVHVIDEGGASAEGALVRLVAPQDHDGAHGRWESIDAAVIAEGRVRGGVCSFERLTADTDLLVQVLAPVPLGTASLRARTPGPGQRASAEVRYSAEDLVLLGTLTGDLQEADWGWSLFQPVPTRGPLSGQRADLDVAADGRFVVRLGPDVRRGLGAAVCLVLHRGWSLLEAVELPPVAGPGSVTLAPVDTAESILCAGRAVLRGEGDFESVSLNVAGSRPNTAPQQLFAAEWAEIDDQGNYSIRGRVPTSWRWELSTSTPGWKVVAPASFRPGDADHDVVLELQGATRAGRLVPGQTLAASEDWAEHLLVRLNQTDGSREHYEFLEPDGSFDVRLPLEEIQSVSVLAKWHDRPVLEWHVVPGTPLVLDLPAELRLVALDVRGADGEPHKARAVPPPGDWAAWYQPLSDAPLVLLLDQPSHDVVVRGEGYRDLLLTGVDGARRVDLLARGVPFRLRALDLPELGPEYRLRPILSRGPKAASNFENLVALDSNGEASMEANGVGEFYVHLQVERVLNSMRMAYLLDGESNPRIHVREPAEGEDPAVFTVTFDRERILELAAVVR